MNRLNLTDEQVAEWVKACKAWAKGKDVQYEWMAGWIDYIYTVPPPQQFDGQVVQWRIKPEPVTVRAWAAIGKNNTPIRLFFDAPNEDQASAHAGRIVELTGEFTP